MEQEKIIADPVFDTKERLRRLEEQVKRVADGIDAMNKRQEKQTGFTLKVVSWFRDNLSRAAKEFGAIWFDKE